MTKNAEARRVAGLYAITPDTEDTPMLLAKVEAALRGGTRWLQYRSKRTDVDARVRQARALRQLCTRHGARLIVNDDADLALAVDADGVHLGAADGSIAETRRRLGPDRVIGASCYDRLDLAERAVGEGADYVAFGSVFASAVKPGAVRAPLTLLSRARGQLDVPIVAIGGVSADNAGAAIAAGAHAVAVISAVFDAPDVEAAARSIVQLFASRSEVDETRQKTG
ncbi:MAG: thiamine phosphate synthase [Pseudomonadota bacterium]